MGDNLYIKFNDTRETEWPEMCCCCGSLAESTIRFERQRKDYLSVGVITEYRVSTESHLLPVCLQCKSHQQTVAKSSSRFMIIWLGFSLPGMLLGSFMFDWPGIFRVGVSVLGIVLGLSLGIWWGWGRKDTSHKHTELKEDCINSAMPLKFHNETTFEFVALYPRDVRNSKFLSAFLKINSDRIKKTADGAFGHLKV